MSPTMAKEIDRQLEELEAENERLKKKLEQTEANNELQCKSLEAHSELITKFRKENAKLKCLALHAMSYAVVSLTSNTNKFKPFRLFVKYNDAYRKAKKDLREGK